MDELLRHTEVFVREQVRTHFPARLCFHNITHFEQVVIHVDALVTAAGTNEQDALALRLAAWMHDLGYPQGPDGHEERSAVIARTFLTGHHAPVALTEQVCALILATRMGTTPANELEAMMKDADIGHIAAPDYMACLGDLIKEQELATGTHKGQPQLLAENIAFLEGTGFHSAAARHLWENGRQKNIQALKAMKDEHEEATPAAKGKDDPEKKAKKAEKKAKKEQREKVKETERGVETMFRVTLNNHTRLSQIADNKANIMLTVNALMISLTLGGPMTKVDKHPEYVLPLGILLVCAAACIITATIATRPSVTHGRTSREDIKNRKGNMLFFGNFHDMAESEFTDGIRELMDDRDYLYGTMTRDLHALGKVLHRKYRFLRITYNIFMIGVTSTVAIVMYMAMNGMGEWPF